MQKEEQEEEAIPENEKVEGRKKSTEKDEKRRQTEGESRIQGKGR